MKSAAEEKNGPKEGKEKKEKEGGEKNLRAGSLKPRVQRRTFAGTLDMLFCWGRPSRTKEKEKGERGGKGSSPGVHLNCSSSFFIISWEMARVEGGQRRKGGEKRKKKGEKDGGGARSRDPS